MQKSEVERKLIAEARTLRVTSATLLVTGALLVVTRTLLVAPGLTTISKDATSSFWPYYVEAHVTPSEPSLGPQAIRTNENLWVFTNLEEKIPEMIAVMWKERSRVANSGY